MDCFASLLDFIPLLSTMLQLVGTNGINYFEIGSANRGDSLDRNIDEENRKTKDFFILVSDRIWICLQIQIIDFWFEA